jgi:toxin CptA
MKSAPAIAFDYRPSRWLFSAIVGISVLALASIALSGLDVWVKFVLVASACAYAAFALRAHVNSGPCRVGWTEGGQWRISAPAGDRTAELEHAAVRGAWIVLQLRRGDGKRITLLLAPDNCDADTRRMLRVRLSRADDAASTA